MIARKFQFALIPAVMLVMVACNLSDQAHAPEKPASPAEPSEVIAAVDTTLEGVDIDSATLDSLMRESEASGNAGLAEEELDPATLDSLIRESGTSDSAIESQAFESAGPVAAKTSAASERCPYGVYRWGGGTCTDPYPVWKKKGVYISRLLGKADFGGVKAPRIQSICRVGAIQKFGVQATVYITPDKPIHLGPTYVSSVLHTCGAPKNALGPYLWLPKIHPKTYGKSYHSTRYWDGLLVGIRARSGDWIEAMGPITLKARKLSMAQPFGKLNGGTPKAMLCPRDYYVAGFIGYRDQVRNSGLTGLRMVCKEDKIDDLFGKPLFDFGRSPAAGAP